MDAYEAIENTTRSGDHPPDYDIRNKGASKATGRIATVYGRYGTDARRTAEIIVEALNAKA